MLRSLFAAAAAARRTASTCNSTPAHWLSASASGAQTTLDSATQTFVSQRPLFTATRIADFPRHSSLVVGVAGVGAARSASTQADESKPKTAYNMFVKEQFQAVKADLQTTASQDVMTELGRRWKALSDTEKQGYSAGLPPKEASVPKVTPPKKWNSYNVYTKEAFPLYKAKAPPGTPSQEIMKQVAAGWKQMSEAQKAAYKAAAEQLKNAGA